MKDVLKGLQAAHTNITILETMRTTLEDGYRGMPGAERSEAFERKIYALITAEQHRLLGVLDRHKSKILKAVQP